MVQAMESESLALGIFYRREGRGYVGTIGVIQHCICTGVTKTNMGICGNWRYERLHTLRREHENEQLQNDWNGIYILPSWYSP